MNLVGYTATALSRNDIEDTPTNKNVVDFAIVELKNLQGNLVVMYDDAEGANPETQKICDTDGQVTFFAEVGDYNLEINGKSQRINLAANIADYIKLGTGESVQEFADSFALKIFQSPTDGGLTEIQTRTVSGGEVYEVRKTSDNSLATIYSDAAGTTEIVQNGTSNVSDSAGVVEFYIADGAHYVEVDGVKSNFTDIVKATIIAFDTVSDFQLLKPSGGNAGEAEIQLGSVVKIIERGSAEYKITTDTPNSYDIIASGVAGLSATFIDNDEITDIQFGLKNDGTDEHAELNLFFTSKYKVLHLRGNGSGNDYKASKSIETGTNKTIYWGDVKLRSIVQVDQGHILYINDGCVIYNPKIDGGGSALIVGGSGQNGYGFNGTVIVYNAYAQNCARGTSAPYDGGKAVQSESHDGADVTIYGLKAVNCHMASSSRLEGVTGTGNKLKIFGLYAQNCNHINFSGVANTTTTDVEQYSVELIGVHAQNCGALDALPEANAGLFLFNRAPNVVIKGVTIGGSTKVEGVLRGRFRHCNISIDVCNQPSKALVNIDPTTLYAVDTSLSEGNNINMLCSSTQDYVLFSDPTDSTFANRFMANSNIQTILNSDVATSFVTPATRNGDCLITVKMGDKKIESRASGFNTNYQKFSSVGVGYTIHHCTRIGSAINGGVDQSQSSGVIIDNLWRTTNSTVTSNPHFSPVADNVGPLGNPSKRPTELFAVSGTINTSDAREKQDIRNLSEKEIAVGRRLKSLIKTFRWIDSFEKKGDSARIHCGWIAQEVEEAFLSEGLNGFEYGALCFDTWDEMIDDNGVVTTEAGERYGVRSDQIMSLVLASI
ncbi:hypothetical protein [Pseudoalteromonas phage PHS21]|nr:hypothetical protein [Pseudoalteromonas phage PHS21]